MRSRFSLILWTADTEPVELLLALILLTFGIVLLLPQPLFSNALVFQAMAKVASEEVWGVGLTLAGLNGVASVLFGSVKYRRITLTFKILFFAWIGTLFVLANPITTGYSYFVYALFAAWAFVRLGMAGAHE